MIKKIIFYFWLKPWFRKLWCNTVLATGWWDNWLMQRKVTDRVWLSRIDDIQACQDYGSIQKDTNAGKIIRGKQYMHNGIRIYPDSYYGYAGTALLVHNSGIHEPQEEYIFQQVLPWFEPGSSMVELGSFWAFYSMWFATEVPRAKNYLLEPMVLNLSIGQDNFELNGLQGNFLMGYAGDKNETAPDGTRVYNMDGIADKLGLTHIHLLHCDIQGFENEFLNGAVSWLQNKSIDWLFISTHSEEIHQHCLNLIRTEGYLILADIPLAHSYSVDGLITAVAPGVKRPEKLAYHLKPVE